MDAPWKKAVSRQISDALVTQLPSSSHNIPEYVECEKYESWEKFFTEILITLTADGVEKYSKNILNSYYLQDWVVDKIKEQLPIEVTNK